MRFTFSTAGAVRYVTSTGTTFIDQGVAFNGTGAAVFVAVGTGSATTQGGFNGRFGLTINGAMLCRFEQTPEGNIHNGLAVDADGTLHVTESTASAINQTDELKTDAQGRLFVVAA